MTAKAPRLYTLIAELTYRCPLRCPYCSNPLDYQARKSELDSADWVRVFEQAEALGALQLNLTGGEPLLRDDLEELVAAARRLELYSNLITSGQPLTRDRLQRLRARGLDAVQVSLQDSDRDASNRIAGTAAHEQKLEVARWVKELGFPLTLNVVLHRENLDRIESIIALAETLGADRLELANAQYLGWALVNRDALLPSREQIDRARAVARAAKARLAGKIELLFVLPDYYGDRPRACMNGWGQRYMVVAPDGRALPCHMAHGLPGLSFDDVRQHSLAAIWRDSPAFAAFRGEAWMSPTCRGCERREIDFGGCRCQAFHLTGEAAATDPVCSLSPHHPIVLGARERAASAGRLVELRYRGGRELPGKAPTTGR
jgi:pyrroloquinoline quinone biosynthesis protein E